MPVECISTDYTRNIGQAPANGSRDISPGTWALHLGEPMTDDAGARPMMWASAINR